MGILQTPHTCYEIEKRFSSIVEELIHLPAIYCHQFHCSEILPFCDRLIKPCYVKWRTENYRHELGDLNREVRKGNFEGREGGWETIQVTATKSMINLQGW